MPEWGELLGLGAIERRPYVSSGLVVLGGEIGAQVLALWHEHQHRADFERSWFRRDVADYPFRFIDQDVLNAVICARVPADQLIVESARIAPHQPYRGLRIVDETTLACAYADGSQPHILHQYLGKPWLEPMYHGIYSRLLSRLWLDDDVAIKLPVHEVPPTMRRGTRALLRRKRADLTDLTRWYVRDVIPEWTRARRDSFRGGRGT